MSDAEVAFLDPKGDGKVSLLELQDALRLAHRAQELSLDSDTDSPFAVLAKDNDICWGGGRPDDITVVVSRVVDPTKEPQEAFTAYTGPGTAPVAITQLPDE